MLVVGSGPTADLAVQLAVLAGTTVVAAAGPAHADRLRTLGAIDVIDSHLGHWAQSTNHRFDAALIAARGTASDAMSLLTDGGRLCSITSDAPPSERGITATDLYVRPDGEELARLAALTAAGVLTLRVRPVAVEHGAASAELVATGHSRGAKYVIEIEPVSGRGDTSPHVID